MKKALAVIAAVLVIGFSAAYFSGLFSSSTSGSGTVSPPAPIGGTSGITTTATSTIPADGTTQPAPTAATTTAASTTPKEVPYVAYNFVITDISGSGFSRTVTAEVSNTGNEDAHNVRGVVQVLQGDNVIKLNGEDSLTVEVGTLPAGSVITVQQTIKFSLLDGLKIQSNGAEFSVTLHSDEATESFREFYKP
jgi:hypothetical protein